MTSDVSREEFSQLDARVAVVEREVDGEKLVTRYILEQTRRNGDDLAAIKGRLGRVESRLDAVETRLGSVETQLGSVEARLDSLEAQVSGLDHKVDALGLAVRELVQSLPAIIGVAVREALRKD